MEENVMLKAILNSYPYPIVFVDDSYRDLIGKSLFDCHDKDSSTERIKAAFEKMKSDGKEAFVGVNLRNLRIYMQPVRDEQGKLIGFFERFEQNLRIDKKA